MPDEPEAQFDSGVVPIPPLVVRLSERDRALIVAGFAEVAATVLRCAIASDPGGRGLSAEELARLRRKAMAAILSETDRAAPCAD